MESLKAYILLSQDETRVETFVRQGNPWVLSDTIGLDSVPHVDPPDCDPPMRQTYRRVKCPSSPEPDTTRLGEVAPPR